MPARRHDQPGDLPDRDRAVAGSDPDASRFPPVASARRIARCADAVPRSRVSRQLGRGPCASASRSVATLK